MGFRSFTKNMIENMTTFNLDLNPFLLTDLTHSRPILYVLDVQYDCHKYLQRSIRHISEHTNTPTSPTIVRAFRIRHGPNGIVETNWKTKEEFGEWRGDNDVIEDPGLVQLHNKSRGDVCCVIMCLIVCLCVHSSCVSCTICVTVRDIVCVCTYGCTSSTVSESSNTRPSTTSESPAPGIIIVLVLSFRHCLGVTSFPSRIGMSSVPLRLHCDRFLLLVLYLVVCLLFVL